MHFVSVVAVGCALASAAVVPEDIEGAIDPAIKQTWSEAQVVRIQNVTTLPDEAEEPEEEDSLEARGIEKRDWCFNTGITLGSDAKAAMGALHWSCSTKLQGLYQVNEVAKVCVNISDRGAKKSVKFELGLTGPNAHHSRSIGRTECIDGMTKFWHCSRGGKHTFGHWYYRMDPNKGLCPR